MAPGASSIRLAQSRPLTGISLISADSTTRPTSALVRLTASAVADTSTVSDVLPTTMLASMVRVSPYCRSIWLTVVGLNPGFVTVSV